MTLTHWTLAKTLKRRGLTAHALVGASGLSKTTVYAIVNGKAQGVTLETVDKLLSGLERLCGEQVRVSEVLEREEEQDDTELTAELAQARPLNWETFTASLMQRTADEQAKLQDDWGDYEAMRQTEKALDRERQQQATALAAVSERSA